MKLHLMSDIHFEGRSEFDPFWDDFKHHLETKGNDGILVLGGDICSLGPHNRSKAYFIHCKIAEMFKGLTIFIPGNHEFYGTSINDVLAELSQWRIPRWHHLYPTNPIGVNGQWFRGGTMWFNGKYDRWRRKLINDFNHITGIDSVYDHNKEFVENVCKKMSDKDIIISHHLPSNASVPQEFKNDPANHFFVSDQEKYILKKQPKMWLHGHTHHAADYMIDQTRVYGNPLGYRREYSNPSFWDRVLVADI